VSHHHTEHLVASFLGELVVVIVLAGYAGAFVVYRRLCERL
jgi:hypothetical protein